MPIQIKRLLIIFAIAIIGLLFFMYLLTPSTFGLFGHYRGDSIKTIIAQDIKYAGKEACKDCHSDIYETKSKSYHSDVACETCHPESYQHTQTPTEVKPYIPRERGHCVLCHEYNPSRPTGFPQIDSLTHNPRKRCISCHSPHNPQPPAPIKDCRACHSKIANMKKLSPHSSLDCVDCHDVPDLHKTTPRNVKPSKPQTRDFCGNCHAKDSGSSNEIPKVDLNVHGKNYLCWQCHYPHDPKVHKDKEK
jgi:hypothetical protein